MNEASEQMKDWLRAADTKRAEMCLTWLHDHLEIELFDQSRPLRESIDRDPEGFLRMLKTNPSMCKAIERTAMSIRKAISLGSFVDDIRIAQCVASMLQSLRLSATEADAAQTTLDAMDAAHEGALRQALSKANLQIDGLCRFIVDIWSFLRQLALGDSRLVLIEMPSGNSLAVKLLARLLEQTSHVEIVRVALSRKHVKPAGITRRQLLAEQLQDVELSSGDVVVYLDEWDTGSNFTTICEFFRKLRPKGSFLFAAAFQTDVATRYERHSSFCHDHDKIMKVWGVPGERFRRWLPPLPTALGGGYFFFSEHDRTAGYRKMQLHGSHFSSIDEAVELLRRDADARRAAAQIFLGELASESDMPVSPTQGVLATLQLFDDSYQDYLHCREEFRRCADEFARGGEIDDSDAVMEQILQRHFEILDNRNATLAVSMAIAFLGRVGSLDPADRYLFEDHAPVLMELEGPAAATHRIVMDVMNWRLLEFATL